jgi:hypothetical protein
MPPMNARRLLVSLVPLAVSAGCGGSASPHPPASAPPSPPPAGPERAAVAGPAAPDASPPAPAFAPLRDRVLAQLLDDEPSVARELGLHEYDGRVAPLSREAIQAQVERLRAASWSTGSPLGSSGGSIATPHASCRRPTRTRST